jgi:hypothetical protein
MPSVSPLAQNSDNVIDMSTTNGWYLTALLITLSFEGPIIVALFRKQAPVGRILLVFLITNSFTHGTFSTVWPHLPGAFWLKLFASEVVVSLVEMVSYRMLLGATLTRALCASLSANMLSTAAGLAYWACQ